MSTDITSEFDEIVETEERAQLPAIPSRPDLEDRGKSILEYLGTLDVTDDVLYRDVDEYRKECVKTQDILVKEVFKDAREFYHERHKAVLAAQNAIVAVFKKGQEVAVGLMKAYDRKKREEAEAEARRLKAEAEEKMRKERQAEAARLAEEGKVEEAKAVIAEPIPEVEVPEVKVQSAVRGNSYATTWKARVTDFAALSDEFKVANESLLNKLAQTKKGQQPPAGVEFYAVESFRGSRK